MSYLTCKNKSWNELNRSDKTSIIRAALMRNIFINGNGYRIGLPEINVNIGPHKNNLRIDVLQINKRKNYLVGYEVKSCIQDFRSDKKWEKYNEFVNELYFVFDDKTYEKHEAEILEKIQDKAGIYVYSTHSENVYFRKGVKPNEVSVKDELFYRTILFNYLWRRAFEYLNRRSE